MLVDDWYQREGRVLLKGKPSPPKSSPAGCAPR